MENLFDFYTIDFYYRNKTPLNNLCYKIGMDPKRIHCKVRFGGKYPLRTYHLPYAHVDLQELNYEEVLARKEVLARDLAKEFGVSVAVNYHARD